MLYVGQTCNVGRRISDYRCKRYRSKKSIIMDSVEKYGWDAHRFEIIEDVDDSLLDEREMFWVVELKTYAYEYKNGMNLTRGGGGVRQPWKQNAERVAKANLRCGKNGPTYGKKYSDEEKRKISAGVSIYNKKNGVKPLPHCRQASIDKISKPVVCYSTGGYFIAEFKSISELAKELNISRRQATDAALGVQQHCHGYIIRHKTGVYLKKIDVGYLQFKNKPITCVTCDGNLIGHFDNARDASDKTGIKFYSLKDALYDKRVMRCGLFFEFRDDYETRIGEFQSWQSVLYNKEVACE